MKPSVVAALFALAAGIPQAASASDWTLTFSTYFGGSDMTTATAVAVDGIGNIYVAGWTDSTSLPGCTPIRPNAGGVDAFVAKWDGATHRIDYCTFLGGRGDDRAFGIAVDGSGYAYITGWTMSANFPVSMPLQAALAGAQNAFVAKLNPAGVLVYSSYLGGNGADSGNAIAVDSSANMTVVGSTTSTKFPLAHPIQSNLNGQTNVFITRLNPAGDLLVYSTYLGGNGNDYGTAVALDGTGAAYLTGSTTSTNFPTVSAFQPSSGGNQDAFVAKINGAGNELVYSTYLGGSGGTVGLPETGTGIAVDSAGDAHVAGNTSSPNFPLANALFSASAGVGIHAFVAELNPAGSELLYSTYLGSSSVDQAGAIAVDSSGNIVAVGFTASPDYPVSDAVQASLAGGYDAFVTRLNSTGTAMLGSTFFGGSGSDAANTVAYTASDAIYIAGQTQSLNLPIVNATQSSLAGAQNAFLAVYSVPAQASAPAAPTDLTAAAGNGSVTLNWTASSGATSYNVYRGTSAGGESTTAIASGITSSSYADSGLSNGTKYYYKVAAVNSGGTSPLSAEASATPEPSAPAAPTGLTAAAGSGSVALSWTAPSGATSYSVYRGTSAGGESTTAIATGITATAYSDTGLTNGTTYYYKVAAVNSGGTSALSAETSATPEPSAPSAPTGLTATASSGSVTLNWTAPSGATSYNVYRGTSAGGESTTALATGITSASYSDSSVTSGTIYYYKVAAVNGSGTSALSAETSATPQPSAPSAPTGLTATAGNSTVVLSWNASSGATSYNVYRGTTTGGESMTAIVTSITSVSYSDTGLTNGTKYYYKVAAVNSGGTSALSAEASATPQVGAASPPVNVSVTPSSGTATTQAFVFTASSAAGYQNIAWIQVIIGTSASPANCYFDYTAANKYLYLDNNAGSAWVGSGILGTSGTLQNSQCQISLATSSASGAGSILTLNLNITSLSGWAGTQTINMATGDNAGLVASWQVMGTWTVTPPSAPSAPTGLTATASSGSVTLNWTASSGATSYNVYRGTSAGGESTTALATGITSASYSDSSVTSGTIYYYKVAAVNGSGTSALSAETSATPQPSAPSAPTGLTATAGNSTVVLSWNASSGATSYNVYRGTTTGGESMTAIVTSITSVSYSDTGLTNGTKYYYKVAAVNSGGTSALSAEASATPQVGAASPPVNVSVTPSSGTATTQAFVFTASSAAGYQNIAWIQVIIGTSASPANCYFDYTAANKYLYLDNNAGSAWVGSGILGMSGTLQNSQCQISLATSSASGAGSILTLNLNITSLSGWAGTQTINMATGDNAGLVASWQVMGTWTVAGAP